MAVDTGNSSESVGLDEYNSNADLASVELFQGYPQSLLLFGSVCCLVFMIIGIPGNLITIIALGRYKKVRNATTIFIIHLHVADLMFCLVILPVIGVTFFNRHWNSGKTMCRLYPMLKYMLVGVSLCSVVAIAINRYVMCCHPLLYSRLFTRKYISLMIIGIWLFNFLLVAPSLFEIFGSFGLDPNAGFCTMVHDKNDRSPKLALLIIAFIIPCIIMSYCYIRIMWVVRRSTRKCRQGEIKVESLTKSESISEENAKSKTQNEDGTSAGITLQERVKATFKNKSMQHSLLNKKDRRLQTMILIIMVTFCICRLPYMLTNTVFKKTILNPELYVIGYTLLHSVYCINPIIYVVISREYRKAYKSLFKNVSNKFVGV